MSKKSPQVFSQSRVTELTAEYYKYIGEIIFKFSCIEHNIKTMIYEVVGVNPSIGRLVIRAARLEEALIDFESICQINHLKINKDGLEKAKKKCRLLKSRRDILAHSVWLERSSEIEEPHDYFIALTTGSLPKLLAKEVNTKSRKIVPQGVPISLKDIKDMAEFAEETRSFVEEYFTQFAIHNQGNLDFKNIALKNSSDSS